MRRAGMTDEKFHAILQRRLKRAPTVKSFETIRDKNNVILGYTVVVLQ